MKKIFKLLVTSAGLFALSACGPVSAPKASNDKNVLSVSLNSDSLELDVNQTATLVPTITYRNGQQVDVFTKWVSGDQSVATVDDNGVVTAKGSGVCDISYLAGYKMAICHVHVKGDEPGPGPLPPTPGEFTITLNQSVVEITTYDTLTLFATTSEPATVTWDSSRSDVATVNQLGVVTPVSEGLTIITATANGKSASCSVTVSNESEYDCTIYFFIDYNNIDENDTTGKKLLTKFDWFQGVPLSESGKIPSNPSQCMDPAFPTFLGWSAHTIIDSTDDLWDFTTGTCDSYYLYLYGIWVE